MKRVSEKEEYKCVCVGVRRVSEKEECKWVGVSVRSE